MIRVILIDDEPWAIESLYHTFCWNEFGFKVIGKFTDPIKGWNAILNDSPDVVFVDIRMPVMSGLEIAAKAKKLAYRPIVIIVSGFDSFDYVQQSLRLGVYDYCLKPVERKAAWGLLSKLAADITKRNDEKCEKTLEDIQNGLSGDELFRQYSVEIIGKFWLIAVLRYIDNESLTRIQSLFKTFSFVKLKLGVSKAMLIFNGDESIGHDVEQTFRLIDNYPDLFIGLSRMSTHADHLYRRVTEAQSCAYTEFVNSKKRLVLYRAKENEEIEKYVSELILSIENRNAEKWIELINGFEVLLISMQVQMHNICRIWNRLMDAFSKFGNGLQTMELEWIMDPEEMRFFLGDVKEMIVYIDSLMHQFLNNNVSVFASSVNNSFQQLLMYVQTHYNQKLRLCDLASQHHLSMAYCSELFRKVTGSTYTDYVTKLRMDSASKALTAGECNLQKLALELGYGDYFTFSKRFKQYFGCPPTKYCGE